MKFFTLVLFLTLSLTQVQTRVSNKFVMQQAIEGLTDCERAIWRSVKKRFSNFSICLISSFVFKLTIAVPSHFKLKSSSY